MPKHCGNGRGSLSQLCHIAGMIEKKSAHRPLIKTGTAIGARDNANLNSLFLGIKISEALGKIDARGKSVGIDRYVHGAPPSVSCYENIAIYNGFHFIGEPSASHIGLSNY
jgi:hypothetical protein